MYLLVDVVDEAAASSETTKRNNARALRRSLARSGVENALAQTERLRGHLNHLVVAAVRDHLFQGHALGGSKASLLLLKHGADVGELLGAHRVELDILLEKH